MNSFVRVSDLLLSWDGEGWDDLLLGSLLLDFTLEDLLEELLVLFLSSLVLGLVLSIAVATSSNQGNGGNRNNDWDGSRSVLLGEFKGLVGTVETSSVNSKLILCAIKIFVLLRLVLLILTQLRILFITIVFLWLFQPSIESFLLLLNNRGLVID